jgi:CMP-2-keto-3-deoxyoctulosonic acid synthetase
MEKSELPQHQSRYIGLYNCVNDVIMYYIITSLRPLTEQELLERRELARQRHMAKEATAATPIQQVDENADRAKENNGKG